MVTPEEQHETLVLTHDTVALPRPTPPAADVAAAHGRWAPAGAYASTAWSQVPPFIAPMAPPVLVMRNNAAVVGATLGSVSLFLSLIPLIGIVAWIIAPVGLLSSGIGLLVGMSRKVGRVGAVWGLLTSGVALLVCLAWAALVLAL
jgi:hypothetical protein